MYGTDGDVLWNDSEEDGCVSSECEEDEGTGHITHNKDREGDTDCYRQIESDMFCVFIV